MARSNMTEIEVEAEIERLLNSDVVKLAKREEQIKNRRRQYLYCLRVYEKRGKVLEEQGITLENIESVLFGEEF